MPGGRPESVERLVEELSKLPGVGRRTAERLADHLVRAGKEEAMGLALAIRDVKKAVRPCSSCGNFAEGDPCPICADERRDRSRLCVVSSVKDLLALERADVWKGLYFVLEGRVAPLDGVGPEDIGLEGLVERVKAGGAEGDMTAHHAVRALKDLGVRVTRLSRGLPSGSSVEFASPATLGEAMEGRREV
jgi:recombination protein RecR